MRSDDYTCSVFYTASNNFSEMEVIILINKFILIQICMNRSRQVSVFVLFCQNAFPKTKKGRPLGLIGFTKSVHLRSDKSLKAFNGFYCTWKPLNVNAMEVL